MGNPAARSAGWLRIPNAAAGVAALGIYTQDPAERVPYVFGLGVNDTGRISTSSRAGAAITFPDDYSFGEAWELRFTFAETGNSQRQGIFVDVRSGAANSSTLRGMEMGAQQGDAHAVGTIEGANIFAGTRGASGNITNLFGLTAELKHNTAYAGTITAAAALRAKFTFDNSATYTLGSVLRLELEALASGGAINSLIYGVNAGGATVNYLLDTSGLESTNYSANRVVLWKFKDSGGTNRFLVYDADAATSVLVDTDEVE
jgi:hypothetical protein